MTDTEETIDVKLEEDGTLTPVKVVKQKPISQLKSCLTCLAMVRDRSIVGNAAIFRCHRHPPQVRQTSPDLAVWPAVPMAGWCLEHVPLNPV